MTPPSPELPLLLDWGDQADTVCAVALAATALYVRRQWVLCPLAGIMLSIPTLQFLESLTRETFFLVDLTAFTWLLYLYFDEIPLVKWVAALIGLRLFTHVLPLPDVFWLAACNGLFLAASGAVAWKHFKTY